MKNRADIEVLQRNIERYLAQPKEVDPRTGWPAVDKGEVQQLADLITDLISIKYAADADGDLPIRFYLCDWTREQPPLVLHVPHVHDPDGSNPEHLNALSSLLAMSEHYAARAHSLADMMWRDAEEQQRAAIAMRDVVRKAREEG